jgi:hypothetical protein
VTKGRIDLIAVKPVETNPGAWDDRPNPKITLWGLYASNLRWRRQFMTDVYFLDYDAKSATYGSQSAREQRRMVVSGGIRGSQNWRRVRVPALAASASAHTSAAAAGTAGHYESGFLPCRAHVNT